MLLTLVILYLLVTIAIGLWAARRVKNTADFAIAGRHLPLVMIITTTFATWFGSETVLGIPAKFVQTGLNGVVEDPFGAGSCLILVGLFFAAKLYKMTLLTISDYYRERYGRVVEVVCSFIIILSYLGWVAAQVTALGLVFKLLSGGAISIPVGMMIGTASILAYTLFGGYLPAKRRVASLERELRQLYLREAELQTKVAQNERRHAVREQQLIAVSAERDALARRLEDVERQLAVARGQKR